MKKNYFSENEETYVPCGFYYYIDKVVHTLKWWKVVYLDNETIIFCKSYPWKVAWETIWIFHLKQYSYYLTVNNMLLKNETKKQVFQSVLTIFKLLCEVHTLFLTALKEVVWKITSFLNKW